MSADLVAGILTPVFFVIQIGLTLYFIYEGPQIGALPSTALVLALGRLCYLQARRYLKRRPPKV